MSKSTSLQPINKVTVKTHETRGRTAFATQAIEAGEVVVMESAALVIRREDAPETPEDVAACPFSELSKRFAVDDDFWSPLRAARRLEPDAVVELMNHLYSPIVGSTSVPADSKHLPMMPSEEKAITALLTEEALFNRCFPKTCPSHRIWAKLRSDMTHSAPMSILSLCQFLHACRINMHSQRSPMMRAIFPTCCKFSHSCNPNTVWQQHPESDPSSNSVWVVHIAVRPIAANEELSFSYVGTGCNMLQDTVARRTALNELHFVCRCERCLQFDQGSETCRVLQCPECGEFAFALEKISWSCRSCCYTLPPSSVSRIGDALVTESMVHALVMRHLFNRELHQYDVLLRRLSAFTSLDKLCSEEQLHPLVNRWRVLTIVERLLGSSHFLFVTAVVEMIRCCSTAVCFAHEGTSSSSELFATQKAIQQMLDEEPPLSRFPLLIRMGNEWFTNNMNSSPQQMVFLCQVQELCGALRTEKLASLLPTGVMGVLSSAEAHAAIGSSTFARLRPLRQWKEFRPRAFDPDTGEWISQRVLS